MNLRTLGLLLLAGAVSVPEAPILVEPRKKFPVPEPDPVRPDPVAYERPSLERAGPRPAWIGLDPGPPPLNERQLRAEAKRARRAERNLRNR